MAIYPTNPYTTGLAIPAQPYPQTMPLWSQPYSQQTYMIYVDGETGAKAWQMPANLPPNSVIPLFDLDGQHVYFRSVDGYGRMNPLRKAKVVFEDPQPLPEGQSGAPMQENTAQFATKKDMDDLKNEIRQMLAQNRQNGRNPVPPQKTGGEER